MAWDEEFDYRNDYQSGREIPRWERREAPIFKSRENRYDEQVIVI